MFVGPFQRAVLLREPDLTKSRVSTGTPTLLPLPGKLNRVHPWPGLRVLGPKTKEKPHLYRSRGTYFFHPIVRVHWGSHESFSLVGANLMLRSRLGRAGTAAEPA